MIIIFGKFVAQFILEKDPPELYVQVRVFPIDLVFDFARHQESDWVYYQPVARIIYYNERDCMVYSDTNSADNFVQGNIGYLLDCCDTLLKRELR